MKRSGFTLVELSIVLVILGLLIGGVLTGQSLIRAAELRSVSTQYSRYMAATMTFRDKYFALPGDMTNAQSYWGVQNATPATCATSASTDSKTCNGDGDGKINPNAIVNESFRFWQHLANAGLIEGSYNGIQQGSTVLGTTSANAPAGRISGSLWFVMNFGAISGSTTLFTGQYDNVFEFGGLNPNYDPGNVIMKPEDVYNMDVKIDDGKPATGKVVVESQYGFSTCTDASAATTLTANYLLSSQTISCSPVFRQQF